jgi:hypothetical protein
MFKGTSLNHFNNLSKLLSLLISSISAMFEKNSMGAYTGKLNKFSICQSISLSLNALLKILTSPKGF